MSHELVMKEAKYQSAMRMFREMLETGIITRENYAEAERLMREKYKPVVGTLFSDMALT
ncbi:SHOCT domain-containing protein [Selenomonas montiformis]|uniref:SHOCT domain-containing protein n=1 Tax=Selenomonas montiformis TaxID=2652285 RepID=UPI0018A7DBB2|nr:SHOCT domain-containing protein [Selenomonas montiformis]